MLVEGLKRAELQQDICDVRESSAESYADRGGAWTAAPVPAACIGKTEIEFQFVHGGTKNIAPGVAKGSF